MGMTALMKSCELGDKELLKALVKEGANCTLKDNVSSYIRYILLFFHQDDATLNEHFAMYSIQIVVVMYIHCTLIGWI